MHPDSAELFHPYWGWHAPNILHSGMVLLTLVSKVTTWTDRFNDDADKLAAKLIVAPDLRVDSNTFFNKEHYRTYYGYEGITDLARRIG